MISRLRWTDQKTEEVIGTLLRFGVILAAAVVLAGGVLYLARHGRSPADYARFRGEPSDFRTVAGIVHAALAGRGQGIIQLGLLLLIATPVARVAFSIAAFAAEGDRMYMGFTTVVLAILLYSLFGS
jgi:uncharacterized membrane protein